MGCWLLSVIQNTRKYCGEYAWVMTRQHLFEFTIKRIERGSTSNTNPTHPIYRNTDNFMKIGGISVHCYVRVCTCESVWFRFNWIHRDSRNNESRLVLWISSIWVWAMWIQSNPVSFCRSENLIRNPIIRAKYPVIQSKDPCIRSDNPRIRSSESRLESGLVKTGRILRLCIQRAKTHESRLMTGFWLLYEYETRV